MKEKTDRKILLLKFDNLQILTGWVNSLSGGQSAGAKGFMFFNINFELSLEGLGMLVYIMNIRKYCLEALVHNQPPVEKSNFGETKNLFFLM